MKRMVINLWPVLLLGVLATLVYGEENKAPEIPTELKPILAAMTAEDFNQREEGGKQLAQHPAATTTLLEAIHKTTVEPELKERLRVILAERMTKKLLSDLKVGMKELPSGLSMKTVREGTGNTPGPLDSVVVHYKGLLVNGKVFDSSYDRNDPATFPVNAVIKGWTEGLQLMKEGGKYVLLIPPELAYGDVGAGETIPAKSTLIFEVELIEVKKQK